MMRPLRTTPLLVSICQLMYWSATALLGSRIDSSRFSRPAFLPIIDRSGPMLPPCPRTMWHLAHCMSFFMLAAKSCRPLPASPLRFTSALIGGRLFVVSSKNPLQPLESRLAFGAVRFACQMDAQRLNRFDADGKVGPLQGDD